MIALAVDDTVTVDLLGPVVLTVAGTEVSLTSVRRRAVLAVLAASGSAPVPAERLAAAIWSDVGHPASRTTLQVHVHQTRQLLGPHAGLLRHTPGGYLLDGVRTDVRTAEDRLRRARAADRAGDTASAAEQYRAALALWRGEFCADLLEFAYLRAARTLYGTVRLDAVESAIAAELRIGTPGLAAELDALVAEHPLRERLWGQLMVALYRDGRQADALAVYRRARTVLAEEAGVDPGAALRHLERAILDQAGATTLLNVLAPGARSTGRPVLTWLDADGSARKREFPANGRVVIGRDPTADVVVAWDGAASRRHAAIVVESGRATVHDLASRNGTFHNGERLGDDPVALRAGDLVRCGDTVLAVGVPPPRTGRPGPDDDTRSGVLPL